MTPRGWSLLPHFSAPPARELLGAFLLKYLAAYPAKASQEGERFFFLRIRL